MGDMVTRERERKAKEAQSQALREKLMGGLSAMWTDRYCYIYLCGAAHEWWARQNGLLPRADLMFSRDLDASFALSLAGMIWPRAGVTASSLWNYQPSITDEILEERTAWLASVLRR